MRTMILLAALFCAPALADSVADNGRERVRITDNPCPPEVLERIPQESRGFFRAAVATIKGQTYQGCWAPLQNIASVHVVYADGDQGLIPVSAFRAVSPSV